jgi:hypothetical protein
MFELDQATSDLLVAVCNTRSIHLETARKSRASEAAISEIKNNTALEIQRILSSQSGIAWDVPTTSKAFLSTSVSLEVVQKSSYSDSGIILEIVADPDVPALPLCVPGSLISEGELQFTRGGELCFHGIYIRDGNVHILASLKPREGTSVSPHALRMDIVERAFPSEDPRSFRNLFSKFPEQPDISPLAQTQKSSGLGASDPLPHPPSCLIPEAQNPNANSAQALPIGTDPGTTVGSPV